MSGLVKGRGDQSASFYADCNGKYVRMSDDTHNNKPVFTHSNGNRFIFYSSYGYWTITVDRSHFSKGTGWVISASTGYLSPVHVNSWLVSDGSEWVPADGIDIKAMSVAEADEVKAAPEATLEAAAKGTFLDAVRGDPKLSKYVERFEDEEITTWNEARNLGPDDLKELNLKIGARKRLAMLIKGAL